MNGRPLVWVLLGLLLAAPLTVQGYEESEAPQLDPRIAEVWHDPPIPAPGTQWNGYIRFVEGHNITAVSYQICDVGNACFAPPTPAKQDSENMWSFYTDDYRDPTFDRPILWGDASYSGGEPWRIGTQFYLTHGDGNLTVVPDGVQLATEECKGRYRECAETHYFAWDMPAGNVGSQDQGAPGIGLIALLALLGLAAYPLRNRHERG